MPAYNEAENIINTLESILRQTIKPELVVVLDDHSSDGTFDKVVDWVQKIGGEQIAWKITNDHGQAWDTRQKKLVASYALPRYRVKLFLVRNLEHNIGKTRNLNWAIYNIVGDVPFILVVDADAVVEPQYAEKLLSVMFRDERIVAAYGWAIPAASRRGVLCKVLRLVRFYKWTRRALVVRRLEDLIGIRYNLMGCALMYRAEAYHALPRPLFGGSRDTLHAWLLQIRGWRVAMLPEAIVYLVYNRREQGLRYYIDERVRWSRGGFHAFFLLAPTLFRRRMIRLLLIALLALIVPLKYSLFLVISSLLAFLGNPYPLVRLLNLELAYYVAGVAIIGFASRRLRLNVSITEILLGALLHYTLVKWLDAVLTLYVAAQTTWERASGKWIWKWSRHKK